jgi:hypothetical protein
MDCGVVFRAEVQATNKKISREKVMLLRTMFRHIKKNRQPEDRRLNPNYPKK